MIFQSLQTPNVVAPYPGLMHDRVCNGNVIFHALCGRDTQAQIKWTKLYISKLTSLGSQSCELLPDNRNLCLDLVLDGLTDIYKK